MGENLRNVEGPLMLWDTRFTAASMSVSERTLFEWTEPRGTLKCVRFPNRTMYRPEDVRTWLDQRQANPMPPKVGKPIVKKPKRGGKRTASTS
ncbi:MAG: hypothetical protein WCH39_28480, partial [Schlesneria sp.]